MTKFREGDQVERREYIHGERFGVILYVTIYRWAPDTYLIQWVDQGRATYRSAVTEDEIRIDLPLEIPL